MSLVDEPLPLVTLLSETSGAGWTNPGLTLTTGSDVGYRSTMRACGIRPQLRGAEERPQANGGAGELVDAALFTIDNAHGVRYPHARVTQRRDRIECRATRGDD